MDNDRLSALFAEAGRDNGFEQITAEFATYKDFKIRWLRAYKWIEFQVSDYLSTAPEEVIAEMADTVFRKIRGEKGPYTQRVCDWLSSEEFVRTNQPTFLRRSRGLSEGTVGNVRDLEEAYQRLIDRGLVERDPSLVILWKAGGQPSRVGAASVLMRVVTMSSSLDRETVPDEVVDYCLYAEIANIMVGFGKHGQERRDAYASILERYPGRDDIELRMRRLCLTI